MKNIFKTLIPCLALSVALTGCYDEMEDKAVIDAKHYQENTVSASIGEVSAINFSTVTMAGSVSSVDGISEVGFMVSKTADFSTYSAYAADELSTSFAYTLTTTDETTLYVRTYAYGIGGTTNVSEVKTVTTPAAPKFEIAGTYEAVDYDADSSEPTAPYEVTVELLEDAEYNLAITNLWDGGMTIYAKYNSETGAIAIPAGQVIYVHASYGDVWIEEYNGASTVEGQFVTKGGYFNLKAWGAVCGAGYFGYQTTSMSHK